MRKAIRIGWILAGSTALALTLCACGSGPQGKPTARSPDDGRGTYKVGRAYNIDGKTYYPAENWAYDEVGIASWYGPGFHGKQTASGERFDQNGISAAHPTLPLPSIVRVTNLDNGQQVVARVNDRGPFAHSRIIDLSKGAAREIGLHISGTAKVRVQLLTRESEIVKQIALQGGGRDEQMAAISGSDSGGTAVASASDYVQPAVQTAPVQAAPLPPVPVQKTYPVEAQPAPSVQLVRPVPIHAGSTGVVAASSYPIYVQAGAFSQAENAERLRAQLSSLGETHVMQTSVSGRDFYRVRIGPMASLEAADSVRWQVIAAGHGDARVVSD
ncbi:MAG: septal ring lytic transglycosylase RlpA family protein [Reyranellaceae bacterium]